MNQNHAVTAELLKNGLITIVVVFPSKDQSFDDAIISLTNQSRISHLLSSSPLKGGRVAASYLQRHRGWRSQFVCKKLLQE